MHVAVLAGGALLAGCPTVDLGDAPPGVGECRPSRTYFEDVLWPEFLAPGATPASCVDAAGCHAQADGRSALRLSTTNPIDFDANYATTTRFLNCGTPSASTLLSKPVSGVVEHGGGDLFAPGSTEEDVFLQWFDEP